MLQLSCEGGSGCPLQKLSATTFPRLSSHVTERVAVPPPHGIEQGPNAPTTHEYVGHGCVLQGSTDAGGVCPAQNESATVSPRLSSHVT